MVEERKQNGKFKNIIDFMNRVSKDVINKRQLEKLIQAGAFDSIEPDRAKLFNNVTKFVELSVLVDNIAKAPSLPKMFVIVP